jgi:hypothetical protein
MRVGSLFGMLDMDRLANTGCASLDGAYTSTEYLLQRSRCFTVPRMGNRYPVGAFPPSGIDIGQRHPPALFRRTVAPDPTRGKPLSVGNGSFLQFLFRTEVCTERTVRQTGGFHHLAYGYVLKSPFTEEARNLLHNPFMFGGGLFGGIAPLPHPPARRIIIKHV